MPRCLLLGLGLLFGLVLGADAWARPRSYEVRGRRIEFSVADDYVLVRPRGEAKLLDIGTEALRVQAKMLGKDVDAAIVRLAQRPPRPVRALGAVLIPRMAGIVDDQVPRIAALSDRFTSSDLVYRAHKQLYMTEGTITVRFTRPPSGRLLFAISSQFGLDQVARPKYADDQVRFKPAGAEADVFDLCGKIAKNGAVRWAEPDLVFEFHECSEPVSPNDTFYSRQWYLQSGSEGINLPEAWALSQGTDKVVVAVVDTGVDTRHADLVPNLVPGYDFVEDDDDPQPDASSPHGTACAGIIAAATGNGRGVAGISWGSKVMPIRIAGEDGFISYAATVDAFFWARDHGAKIFSCSWSSGYPNNQEWDMVEAVTEAGCLVIASSSNEGDEPSDDYVHFPAAYDQCIAVGAIRPDNTRWSYSCFGPPLDLVAPSSDGYDAGIWTTDYSGSNGYNEGGSDAEEPTGDYMSDFSGTSAAAPVVAGVAALVWSTYPDLTLQQVRQALEETAIKIDLENGQWKDGRSKYYGWGKVDAKAALLRAAELARGTGPMSEEERRRYIKKLDSK